MYIHTCRFVPAGYIQTRMGTTAAEDVNNIIYEVFGSDDKMDSSASDILSDIEVDIHYTSDRDIDEEFM